MESCTSDTNGFNKLTVQPPEEVEKIWTITKTETALIVTCNNVEVLNYLFADSPKSNCVKMASKDVGYIKFDKQYDKHSKFYRAGNYSDRNLNAYLI